MTGIQSEKKFERGGGMGLVGWGWRQVPVVAWMSVSAYTSPLLGCDVEDWGGFVTALCMCVESTSLLNALYK